MRLIGWAGYFAAMLAALAPAAAQEPATAEARFAAAMAEELQRRLPDSKVTVVPADPLSVRMDGGQWNDATINFHRIFGFCRNAAPTDCTAAKKDFLYKILTARVDTVPRALRIAVRDRSYVEHVRALPADALTKQPPILARPIGDDLFAIIVADSPQALKILAPADVRDLGLTLEQVWTRAWLETRLKLPPLPTADQLKKNAVAYQDQEYLASLLADTDGWRRVAAAAGPDLFMTVVADNFVFVGTMKDGPDLEKFRQAVREDCAGQQRCVSPNLYRFRAGRWVIAPGS